MKLLVITSLVLAFPCFGEGDELDANVLKALSDTQKVLENPVLRNETIKRDKAARGTNQQVEAITGSPENTQALYLLSSEVMADLVKMTKGDPNELAKLLDKANRDPAAFANQLSPEIRAKINALSKKIPDPSRGRAP